MRVIGSIALVVAVAVGPTAQSQSGAAVLVIDSDAHVSDATAAVALRDRVASVIEAHGPVAYFDLSASSLSRVPGDETQSFRRTRFTVLAPAYGGISLSLHEALEILRKNEAVRDSVIQRECAGRRTPDCGGAVHAAAIARADDTDAASRAKLQRVTEFARTAGARVLVIVTAGWPCRDEGRVDLEGAVRTLRETGVRLVVVRLPSAVPYGGLIRDASEQFARRLDMPFVLVHTAPDADRVGESIGPTGSTDPAVPASPATVAPSAAGAPASTGGPAAPFPAGLRGAAEYVTRFERTFAAVIWRESYLQEVRTTLKFRTSGNVFTQVTERRHLESELFFLWLPSQSSWIAVRDVTTVDGVPRPDGERRMKALLAGSTFTVDQLRPLATENARYNIGKVLRTFTEPTLGLLFLDEHYRDRFAFTADGDETVAGRRGTRYRYVERGRPTVIQNEHRDVPARGSLVVESGSGRILQTTLELSDSASALEGLMTVRYATHPGFDVMVPVEMRESYTGAGGETITTVARYSDFRRFQTSGRIVIPQ